MPEKCGTSRMVIDVAISVIIVISIVPGDSKGLHTIALILKAALHSWNYGTMETETQINSTICPSHIEQLTVKPVTCHLSVAATPQVPSHKRGKVCDRKFYFLSTRLRNTEHFVGGSAVLAVLTDEKLWVPEATQLSEAATL